MSQSLKTDPYYQLQAILSRRDHSITEAKRKLQKKGFSSAQITTVIEWGIHKGFLNDEKFIERYITSTLRQKAVGPRWLQSKLTHKGLPSALITAALQKIFSPAQERIHTRAAAQRWRDRHPTERHNKDRLYRFLVSRGFSSSVIEEL